MEIKKIVKPFGKRGAHIYLPRKLLNKEVLVIYKSTLIRNPIKPEILKPKPLVKETKIDTGLDEAERDFLEAIRRNPLQKPILIQKGKMQFGVKRVEEILKFI